MFYVFLQLFSKIPLAKRAKKKKSTSWKMEVLYCFFKQWMDLINYFFIERKTFVEEGKTP